MRFRTGRRSGFALASALAVILLFAFVTAILYFLILEGDRRVQRLRGRRLALQLAESAVAVMERRFTTDASTGAMPPLKLNGGTATGSMSTLGLTRYRIVAVGEVPIPGGQSARAALVIEGDGDPDLKVWTRRLWRHARADEEP